VQLGGDVGIGETPTDGDCDLALAGAERGQTLTCALVALARVGIAGDQRDQAAGDGG